jgi:hypothetical protein
MIDSDITDEKITNDEIIEVASNSDPHFVVPKDYVNAPRETANSINEFLAKIRESPTFNATPVLPLQPDSTGSYDKCATGIDRSLTVKWPYVALGGLVRVKNHEKFNRIKAGVKVIHHRFGRECRIHLFGVYPSRAHGGVETALWKWLTKYRLITSLDSSTDEIKAVTGKVRNLDLETVNLGVPSQTSGIGTTWYKHRIADANCWATLVALNRRHGSTPNVTRTLGFVPPANDKQNPS